MQVIDGKEKRVTLSWQGPKKISSPWILRAMKKMTRETCLDLSVDDNVFELILAEKVLLMAVMRRMIVLSRMM